jgi:hypothetical protein
MNILAVEWNAGEQEYTLAGEDLLGDRRKDGLDEDVSVA